MCATASWLDGGATVAIPFPLRRCGSAALARGACQGAAACGPAAERRAAPACQVDIGGGAGVGVVDDRHRTGSGPRQTPSPIRRRRRHAVQPQHPGALHQVQEHRHGGVRAPVGVFRDQTREGEIWGAGRRPISPRLVPTVPSGRYFQCWSNALIRFTARRTVSMSSIGSSIGRSCRNNSLMPTIW